MSFGGWIAVALLGGLMAVARFGLDSFVSDRFESPFPLGILVVNLLGAAVVGIAAGAGLGGTGFTILAGGITGSLTTFSTWILDSERLASSGLARLAWLNLGGSLAAGLLAVALGHWLGAAL